MTIPNTNIKNHENLDLIFKNEKFKNEKFKNEKVIFLVLLKRLISFTYTEIPNFPKIYL